VLRETSVVSLPEFPRIRATRIIINTAPPTIHTQGWAYHSVVVVVVVSVVTLLLEEVLSCAHKEILMKLNKKITQSLKILLQFLFITVDLINNEISK
jgi:hypothetical protein